MSFNKPINVKFSSRSIKSGSSTKVPKLLNLPNLLDNSSKNDFVIKSLNPCYFSFRLKKPLNIVEHKQKLGIKYLLLTKVQRKKLDELKEKVRKIQKEKLRTYVETNKDKIKYKNMIPMPIWSKCEETYEKYKKKYKKLIKLNNQKTKTTSRFETKEEDIKNKFDENNKLKNVNFNLSARNIRREQNKLTDNKKQLNITNKYGIFNKYNNFKRCISSISIKHNFDNLGLNKFIERTENQSYFNLQDLLKNNSHLPLKS